MKIDLICPYLKGTQTYIKTEDFLADRTITEEYYMPCKKDKCPFFDCITGECKKVKMEERDALL